MCVNFGGYSKVKFGGTLIKLRITRTLSHMFERARKSLEPRVPVALNLTKATRSLNVRLVIINFVQNVPKVFKYPVLPQVVVVNGVTENFLAGVKDSIIIL